MIVPMRLGKRLEYAINLYESGVAARDSNLNLKVEKCKVVINQHV
jgi:hypothetical protein